MRQAAKEMEMIGLRLVRCRSSISMGVSMVAFVVFVVFLTCVGLSGTVVSVADLTSMS